MYIISIYIKDSKSLHARRRHFLIDLFNIWKWNRTPIFKFVTCCPNTVGTYQENLMDHYGGRFSFCPKSPTKLLQFQSLSHLDTKFSCCGLLKSHWFLVFSGFFNLSSFHSCFPQCQLFSKFNLLNYSRRRPPLTL